MKYYSYSVGVAYYREGMMYPASQSLTVVARSVEGAIREAKDCFPYPVSVASVQKGAEVTE